MLKIIGADERLAQKRPINLVLFGQVGVGKTSQARTLDPLTTLFLDLEAGTLALQDWGGDVINVRVMANELRVHPWEFCRALACFLGGPDPADADGPYSASTYAAVCAKFGGADRLAKYKTVYIDSLTVASRMALQWAQKQPEAFSEKTGRPDLRGAYGLLGRELVRWFTHLQHAPFSTVLVAALDRETDDLGRTSWVPQIDGSKAGLALPGIFDQVVTLALLPGDAGPYRAFVCHALNPHGLPGKDRSGLLDMIEPPDLGQLIHKMQHALLRPAPLSVALPVPSAGESIDE